MVVGNYINIMKTSFAFNFDLYQAFKLHGTKHAFLTFFDFLSADYSIYFHNEFKSPMNVEISI